MDPTIGLHYSLILVQIICDKMDPTTNHRFWACNYIGHYNTGCILAFEINFRSLIYPILGLHKNEGRGGPLRHIGDWPENWHCNLKQGCIWFQGRSIHYASTNSGLLSWICTVKRPSKMKTKLWMSPELRLFEPRIGVYWTRKPKGVGVIAKGRGACDAQPVCTEAQVIQLFLFSLFLQIFFKNLKISKKLRLSALSYWTALLELRISAFPYSTSLSELRTSAFPSSRALLELV